MMLNVLFNADVTLSLERASVQVREGAGSVILVVSRNVRTSAVDINFNFIIRSFTALGMSKIFCSLYPKEMPLLLIDYLWTI